MPNSEANRHTWGLGLRILTWILALIAALWLVARIVDWLWMGALGYRQVFWRILIVQLTLFATAFVPLSLYFYVNVRAVLRTLTEWWLAKGRVAGDALFRFASSLDLVLPILLALIFAFWFAAAWDDALRFWFGGTFGRVEPIIGHDVGFYLFRLPLIQAAIEIVLLASTLMLVMHGSVYFGLGAFHNWQSLDYGTRRRAVRLLGLTLILVAAAAGLNYLVERYELLYGSTGTVVGPGYTDANVVMPTLWVMTGIMAAVIVASALAIQHGKLSYLFIAVGGATAAHALALWIVPGFVQRFIVDPNELERERVYLENNIAFTRYAFGIDNLKERNYPAATDLKLQDLEDNRDIIRNIRLWDYRPLLRTFQQIQQIRLYYQFYDVDVDRYQLTDGYRQVMLSARELTPSLPSRANTWVNRHLQYTHGYGLAMTLAAQEGEQGSPTLIVKDLPPAGQRGIEVKNPAIYFGEHMPGFRIVPSDIRELDYPAGDTNVYASYDGDGGVPVNSFWRRLLFAFHLFDVNILLTDYVKDGSLIQIRRPLQERISHIAPFLTLDRDPYLVVSEGHLFWIQDAYTTSDRFPYSEAYRLHQASRAQPVGLDIATERVRKMVQRRMGHGSGAPFNYIRNSVKIVVDAYNGGVSFFVMDPDDPVLAAYRDAFPELFQPLSALPAGLKDHLRYPQDLFEAQIARYSAYHMRDPQVFYNKEDLWRLPKEKYGGTTLPMEPYYILVRLPGEEHLQFMLMTPLTPQGRDNMIAWIAARSDFPGYGEVVGYKLPKERLIFGPAQIEALIDQDTTISRQLSLWDQRGSRVIRGNLLAIPIDHSLIYVEPVYLVAEDRDVPQLKRVIVVYGDRVVMDTTLDQAIRVLFGKATPQDLRDEERRLRPPAVSEIRARIEEAEAALARGDWAAFGAAMEKLKRATQTKMDSDKSGESAH